MLKALTAGLSARASDFLLEALNIKYGEGLVNLVVVDSSDIRVESRIAQSAPDVVFVSLDKTSEALADPRLRVSNKYLPYEDDSSFASLLNSKFGTSFAVEVFEVSQEDVKIEDESLSSRDNSEIEKLRNRLQEANSTIENLSLQISDLRADEDFELVNALKTENLSLKSQVTNLEARISSSHQQASEIERCRNEIEALSSRSSDLSDQIRDWESKFAEQSVILKTKDSQIKIKDATIESLNSQLEGLQSFSQGNQDCERKIKDLTGEVARLARYEAEASELSKELESTRASLLEANTKVISFTDRLRAHESVDLSEEISTLKNDPFTRLKGRTQPNSQPYIGLELPDTPNIRYVFPGSDGSLKVAYRHTVSMAKSVYAETGPGKEVLLIDLSGESVLDYVLGYNLNEAPSSKDWLMRGGGVQEYVFNTRIPGLNVMTMGTDYFNDSCLISVNWKDRLEDLNNSGYEVIIFGGTISSLVGRFLASNLSNGSDCTVVSEGFVTSIRSLIFNLRGIKSKPSLVINRADVNYTKTFIGYLTKSGYSITATNVTG